MRHSQIGNQSDSEKPVVVYDADSNHTIMRGSAVWKYRNVPKFRVLSVDGGGIRGLTSLYLLKQLETDLKEAGCIEKTLSEAFDMTVGTSTGGIVAAGIAHGLDCDTLISIYEDNAKKIFPPGFLKGPILGYSNAPIEALAKEHFSNPDGSSIKMKDLKIACGLETTSLLQTEGDAAGVLVSNWDN